MRERIGIFGGSFDPIHIGHVEIAKYAVEEIPLDRLIVIPAGAAPHKSGAWLKGALRLKMTRAAIAEIGDERIVVSNYEILAAGQGKKSYTVDTMRRFQNLYPLSQIYFILGTDMLFDLPNWKNPEEIVRGMKLVLAHRPEDEKGVDISSAPFPPDFVLSHTPASVSSTEIRRLIKEGKSIHNLVPNSVENLIQQWRDSQK